MKDSVPRIALVGDKPLEFGGSVVSGTRMSRLLEPEVEMIPISLDVSLREKDWSGKVEKTETKEGLNHYRIIASDFKADRALNPLLGESMLNYDLRRRSWAERLYEICRAEQVSAVHVYGGFEQRAFIGAYAAALHEVPLVITYIGQDLEARIFGRHLAQTVQATHGAQLITCKSEHSRRIIQGLLRPGCPVEIIRNSVSESSFDSSAVFEKWGEGPVIGCFAEFRRVTGLDTLISAYRILLSRGHRPILALGGPFRRTEVSYYDELIGQLPPEARVWRMGRIPHQKMLAAQKMCDVVAAPSFADTSPYKVLEAMLARTPIIGTTAGGIPDLVTHGKEALLVSPGDAQAMAGALESVLTDPKSAEGRVEAAYDRVTSVFNRKNEKESWLNAYARAGLIRQ